VNPPVVGRHPGRGGFGTPGTPGGRIGTLWNTPDIWLRGEYVLEKDQDVEKLSLEVCHDEDFEVYINGVPLNDPEDQATYFVDLPDFAAEVTDIQIERGVGSSLYGDASFGGSVNIASAALDRERTISLSTGYGSFFADGDKVGDMRKQAFEYSSGLIGGQWSFSGR